MKRLIGVALALAALVIPMDAQAGVTITSPASSATRHFDQLLSIAWSGSSLTDANATHRSTLTFTGVYSTFTMELTAAGVNGGSLAFVPDTPVATFLAAHPEVASIAPSVPSLVINPDVYTITLTIRRSDGTTSATGSVTGVTIESQCAPGTYSSDGWPPCTQATPGHYVYTGGSTGELPCEPGRYNSTYGSYSCFLVPQGTYTAQPGAIAPSDCLIGSYQDEPGQASCKVAPAGTFVDVAGALAATPCPTGTTSPVGSTSVSACVGAASAAAQASSTPTTESAACTVARGARVTAACVAKQLGLSIARPKRARVSLAPRRQAACTVKRRVLRGAAAGTCSVVLVITARGAMPKSYRATITISA